MILRYTVPSGFTIRSYIRNLATHANDGESHIFDSKWTKDTTPTPYSVFGFAESAGVDRKQLKKRYHEFVKIYHPDISQNISITRTPEADDVMSQGEKLTRFRIVTNAYEILRDDNKKRLYDHTRSGWSYGPEGARATTRGYQYANTHGYKSNASYAYYNAGTWEDLHDLNNNERPKLDPWTAFIWICGLLICFEGTALLSRIEDSMVGNHFTQEETENDLVQSRVNYGLDTDKFTRLRRFLWFRTFGLYRSKEELDREAIKNEQLVQNLKKKGKEE